MDFDQHPDSNSTGKPHVTARLESQLGKGSRQCVRSMGETSKIAVWGFPIIIPGHKMIPSSICDHCKPGFTVMMFVWSYKTWNVAKPGAWLARPLQDPKIPPPSYLRCSKSCTPSRQSLPVPPSHSQSLPARAVSRQVRSKVRGLLCFVSEA